MEFDRKLDGTLTPLPRKHVDTGMGLERLTAVLNGKTSNYDTDLFSPLFEVVERQTGAPSYSGSFDKKVDTDYRILADHCRMLSVCLSDGMFPESSPKLKQVLRRTIRIAKQGFLGSRKGKLNGNPHL
jgi:alanyl-tRNA synthetase